MDKSTAKKGNLAITLSTFLYILFDRNVEIHDQDIVNLCNQIEAQSQKSSVEQVVATLQEALPADVNISNDALQAFVTAQGSENDFQIYDPFELGKKLVEVVQDSIAADSSVEDVFAWLQERVPSITNGWTTEDDKSILQNIRQYEFKRGLPWVGRIAERTNNGIEEMWIMVEKVTDTVLCMDPYPWDDVDEEFYLDIPEFLLRWELAGAVAIHLG